MKSMQFPTIHVCSIDFIVMTSHFSLKLIHRVEQKKIKVKCDQRYCCKCVFCRVSMHIKGL